ncbi:hypothetical protein [Pseudoxanthomonas spadix]|uniref:hypothetical protein n=1 Tax=Pseudoxanthomonas spadix TaxID=415229 RepID=UPI0011D1E193|nr:hypothetical protein [Pseudoxanthomonas spadix]
MKRMRFSARGFSPAIAKLAFSSVMALALSSMISPKAMAGAVYRCDGCTSSEKMEVARSGPLGFTYVVDTAAAELTLWSVEYDGESRRKKANESRVDSVTYNRFRFFLERPSAAPGLSAAGTSASAQAGGGGSGSEPFSDAVKISPNDWNRALFYQNPFDDLSGSNAYEVVNSASERTMLGQNIATALAASGTGNAAIDKLGPALNSFMLGLGGAGKLTIVIVWSDGSKTTYYVDSQSTTEAKYVTGESRDSLGNPVPDAAASSDRAGEIYGGQFYFSSDAGLSDWVNTARNYGVPVTGSSSGSRRLSCTWDGEHLACKFI